MDVVGRHGIDVPAPRPLVMARQALMTPRERIVVVVRDQYGARRAAQLGDRRGVDDRAAPDEDDVGPQLDGRPHEIAVGARQAGPGSSHFSCARPQRPAQVAVPRERMDVDAPALERRGERALVDVEPPGAREQNAKRHAAPTVSPGARTRSAGAA
jgi:hypothetical protein